MRRLSALLLALALLASVPAYAAGPPCGTGGVLNPINSSMQTFTVSSTARALPSIPDSAMFAVVIVRTNSIRSTDDGTTPTTSVGMPYGPSSLPQVYGICGRPALVNTRMIAISSDSEVNISYYAP